MFIIYGTPNCIWCERAKKLIDDKFVSYIYIDLTESVEAQKMFKDSLFKTVPQIFYGNTHVGGYESLKNFLDKPSPDHTE